MLVVWLVVAMLFFPQQGPAGGASQAPLASTPTDSEQQEMMRKGREEAERQRQIAIRINELAGHIQSQSDAQAYVNALTKVFSERLAYWVTSGIRARIARAESSAATDRNQLIPERRIADAFNRFLDEIGAPQEAHVTAAEIHNMRDAQYTTARMVWPRYQSVWTMPNMYALGEDGKVACGCRAVEALHALYMLHDMYGNLIFARERLKQGIVVSDRLKEAQAQSRGRVMSGTRLDAGPLKDDPLEDAVRRAEHRYLFEHGPHEYETRLKEMFDAVMP